MTRWGRITASAVLAGTLCGPMLTAPARALDFGIEAAFTYDDNVARAEGAGNVLSDQFFAMSVNAPYTFQSSTHTRLVADLVAGGDFYRQHDGLSRYFGGIQGEFQYRSSGQFDASTIGFFLRTFRDEYDSELRDGYRYNAGVRMLKPLTDRIEMFAALAYNKRDGSSAVFDTEEFSAALNLDYAPTRRSVFYLGAEYRKGDVVSTARPSLLLITVADAVVRDDAFTDTERLAYRINADTVIATLGYNFAFGESHSVDFSWRWAHSTAQDSPGFGSAGKPEYTVNQLTLVYLGRF